MMSQSAWEHCILYHRKSVDVSEVFCFLFLFVCFSFKFTASISLQGCCAFQSKEEDAWKGQSQEQKAKIQCWHLLNTQHHCGNTGRRKLVLFCFLFVCCWVFFCFFVFFFSFFVLRRFYFFINIIIITFLENGDQVHPQLICHLKVYSSFSSGITLPNKNI